MRKPSEIELLAKQISEREVFFKADELVEYLLSDEDLDAFLHISNRWWCPICDVMSNNCRNSDEHEFDIMRADDWYAISKPLATDLESLDQMVLQLDSLEVYFWGHCDRSSGDSLDNDIFYDVVIRRQNHERKA
jgi:hypothetical protein